ncbi:MAG: IPT/TIG domain-containing protein [Acidobacteria bacterium]|nr:IPT/TIG domain-containing protein [Acidobacteriota bacterium]
MKQKMFWLSLWGWLSVLFITGGAPVQIEGVYPESAPPGAVVVVKGQGFTLGNPQVVWAANVSTDSCPGFVEFNGARGEIQLWQDNLVMVRVPEHANSGPVRLTLTSGLSVTGNHFEVTPEKAEDEMVPRRRYAFEENTEFTWADYAAFSRSGLYPSPYYFYQGYQPAWYGRRGFGGQRWGHHDGWYGDGGLDFFLTSGPLLRNCGLFTGLDSVMFFPAGFYNDFSSRFTWWDGQFHRHAGSDRNLRRRYRFEE